MPEVTIKFSLPEEEVEFKHTANANDYFNAMVTFSEELRIILKHSELDEKEHAAIERIKDLFWRCVEDEGVDLL